MIGLEEVSACSAVEGIGSCQERSASEIADVTGNNRPHLSSYGKLLNQNAISIVGEKEARENNVSLRKHHEGDLGVFSLNDLIKKI